MVVALRPDEAITDYQSTKAALGEDDGLYTEDDLIRASQNASAAGDSAAAVRLAQMAEKARETPDGTLKSSERTKMDRAVRDLKAGLVAILVPILGTLVLGAAFLWAIRGFRRDSA